MSKLVPIGRFAELTGLAPSALRFYDEIGLLRPATVDPDTGYRYYHKEQTVQAERVRLLRSLDVPIQDVRTILSEKDPTAYQERLEKHRRKVEAHIAAQQQALATLELLSTHGELPYHVNVKEVPEQPVLFRRFLMTLADIDRTREQGFRELHAWLHRHGVTPVGPNSMMVIDEDIEVATRDLDLLVLGEEAAWTSQVDLAVALPHPVEPEPPLECGVWPAVRMAYAVHHGPYEPLHLAARTVRAWVFENSYAFAGPKREVYYRGPFEKLERSRFYTEVQYPIGETGRS